MNRRYKVTLYNQAAMCGIAATGPSRPKAFKNALAKAGEPFMRAGNRDILTGLRTLFADHLMSSYYRTAYRASTSDPRGFSVEFERQNADGSPCYYSAGNQEVQRRKRDAAREAGL